MTFFKTPLTIAATVAALVLPGASFAQDAADAPATGSDLPLGETVQTEPQVGQEYTVEAHGDWKLNCIRRANGGDPCTLNQPLFNADGNQVAEINVFGLPGGGEAVAGATILTPLGTLLPQGISLAVDDKPAKRYPFSFCTETGCVARAGLTAEDIDFYKKGAEIAVILVNAQNPGAPVELTVSLRGFTAGYDAVNAKNVENLSAAQSAN